MCLTCGCMDSQGVEAANDEHSDGRHLTYDKLNASAIADGITPAEAAKRMTKYAKAFGKAHPEVHGETLKKVRKRLRNQSGG